MALFSSTYLIPKGLDPQFGGGGEHKERATSVYALDHAHLAEILRERNMGERMGGMLFISEPEMPSDCLAYGKPLHASHALIWITMIAIRWKPELAWELLNDEGLLHRLQHLIHGYELDGMGRYPDHKGTPWATTRLEERHRLTADIAEFERTIPGVHRCWGVPLEKVASTAASTLPRYDDNTYAARFGQQQVAKLRMNEEYMIARNRILDKMAIRTTLP